MNAFKRTMAVCVLATGLAACGGGSSSSSGSSPPPQAASPGGIWTGTDSLTGMQVTALISETGQMEVMRLPDRAQFFGTLVVSGSSINADIDGDSAFGASFPDGSIHGTGKLTGTLSQRTSIQATIAFTTDLGESTTSTVSLTYQSYYSEAPNTAKVGDVAGNYTETYTGATVTIHSDGTVFAQDSNSGCVINGTLQPVNAAYDLYSTTVTYASCTGASLALNGLQFDGLAIFGANNFAAMHDTSGKHYGLVFVLTGF